MKFPSASKHNSVKLVSKVFVPDGVNGDGRLGAYDENLELQETNFSPNNIALIRLAKPWTFSGLRELEI